MTKPKKIKKSLGLGKTYAQFFFFNFKTYYLSMEIKQQQIFNRWGHVHEFLKTWRLRIFSAIFFAKIVSIEC